MRFLQLRGGGRDVMADRTHVNVHWQWPLIRRIAALNDSVDFLRNRKAGFDVLHNVIL